MNRNGEVPSAPSEQDVPNAAGPKRKPIVKVIVILLVVFLVGAQFVPVDRTNPPVNGEIEAPAEVKAILKRSCYDCHSNETVWPWYSYVAPVSWLVADDVEEAREKMNFSTWDRYGEQKKAEKLHDCWEEVAEGDMPLWFYRPLHPDARLSDADRQTLHKWTKDARKGAPGPQVNDDDDDD